MIKSTKATEAGNLWYTHWGDFQDYRSAPENVSTTTTVSDVTGIYQYKVSLVVSVYQYQSLYDCDSMNLRVAVYIESSSTELPAYAWRVMIDIEKDTSGSDLNRQTMETVYSDVRPGFSQSYGLSQTSSTKSDYDDRKWWAFQALAFAAGLFYRPISVVTGLINIAKAFLPAGGVDYRNAGPEDPEALIWWNDGFGDLGENKQYCLNSIQWKQDPDVNPSTYYGLKIWARVALVPQLVPGLPPDIDTPPVSLRIYHNDPPENPSTPSGSTSGYVDATYSYSTRTTDPNGNDVCYEFDWGDGYTTTTGWYASGDNATASHSWSSLGTYDVMVRAKDSYNLWSDWSPPLTVNIRNALTVLAEDQYGYSLTTGDVYIDGKLVGYTGSTYVVLKGTHEVFVNDFWETSTGYRYSFQHWQDGSTDNPRTITITEDTTITAHFYKKWCPGDVNGDGVVNIKDVVTVGLAFGSQRDIGDPWPPSCDWNSRADLMAPYGEINIKDVVRVSIEFGNEYPDP